MINSDDLNLDDQSAPDLERLEKIEDRKRIIIPKDIEPAYQKAPDPEQIKKREKGKKKQAVAG